MFQPLTATKTMTMTLVMEMPIGAPYMIDVTFDNLLFFKKMKPGKTKAVYVKSVMTVTVVPVR